MPLNDASTDAMDIRANCAYDLRHRLSGLVKRIAEGAVGVSVGGPGDIAAAKEALAAAKSG